MFSGLRVSAFHRFTITGGILVSRLTPWANCFRPWWGSLYVVISFPRLTPWASCFRPCRGLTLISVIGYEMKTRMRFENPGRGVSA